MESKQILKVSSNSNCSSVAGALANCIRLNKYSELQAVGAGAINQAVKSIAIARGFLAPSGINIVCIPAFASVTIEGEEKTAINFIIKCER